MKPAVCVIWQIDTMTPEHTTESKNLYIDDLVEDCSNSSALLM